MAPSPTTADVVELIAAWGGAVEPSVLRSLEHLDVDTLMRAFTTTVSDLLGSVADETAGHDPEASLLVERAVALARSGQMSTAAAVAEPLIERAGLSPAVRAALLQTTVLTLTSAAHIGDVDRVVAGLDRSLYSPAYLRRLGYSHQFAHVLSGDRAAREAALAAEVEREVTPATGTLPLMMRAVGLMLIGAGREAVETSEMVADGYRQLASGSPHELASVDIWPPRFRYFTHGRHDARRHVEAWQQRTATSGQAWIDSSHRTNTAMIAMAFGEIDGAIAGFDAAVEAATRNRNGWISWAIGARARLDILHGALDQASERIEAFRATALPDVLGLHQVDLADAELAVAENGLVDPAGCWSVARDEDNRLWQLLCGLDLARIARRSNVSAEPILQDLTRLEATPALQHVPRFARAVLEHDITSAVDAVQHCRSTFSVVDAARLAADTAILAARSDRTRARQLGAAAIEQLTQLGADGEVRSVRSELRDHGLTLGVRGKRTRASTGWDALTATETKIAALVADGLTGPEIARQLYISPRTVQTHVSSILKKLGIHNRLELVKAHRSRTSR